MRLYEVVAGSRLYGTNRPDSDYDIRAVIADPVITLIGLKSQFEVKQEMSDEMDLHTYGLRKFANLCLGANPNMLELLFAPENAMNYCSEEFQKILDIKHLFLSQKIRNTFGGYARGQIKQISQKEYKPEGSKANLIEQYGWDTKAGMHLFRMCYQGRWLLTNPQTYSPRFDQEGLEQALNILHGGMSKESVLVMCSAAVDAFDTLPSELPDEPDYARVEYEVMQILRKSIERYYAASEL